MPEESFSGLGKIDLRDAPGQTGQGAIVNVQNAVVNASAPATAGDTPGPFEPVRPAPEA